MTMSKVVRTARDRGLTVYTHKQWGSKHRKLYWTRLVTRRCKRRVKDTLWQHITVTRDDGKDRIAFFMDMQELERIGNDRFGSGVSYNVAIDMETGEIGIGQFFMAKGTHTINHKQAEQPNFSFDQNAVSLAFAFIGMPGQKPSRKAIRAAGIMFGVLIDRRKLTFDPDYVPHRLVAFKSCPTDAVVDVMPEIKRIAYKTSKKHQQALAKRASRRGRTIGG